MRSSSPPSASVAATAGPPPATDGRDRTAVWRYLRMLGASADEADDLAQDTLLVALQGGLPAEPERARAFLRGIARNLWLRTRRWWFRRREREVAMAVEQLWLTTAAADDGDELVARLHDCLDGLQGRARQALERHYRDGLPWPQVAAELGMKPNGTKTLVQRARQLLRQCLERSGS